MTILAAVLTKYYINMKARLNQILLVAILSLFLINLSSCENDPNETILNVTPSQSEESIRNFMFKAHKYSEGNIFKNNEKLPIQDAIEYISNTFNYEYCFPFSKNNYGKRGFVQVKIPIIAAEEKTYLVDALSAYNTSVEKVRTEYKKLNEQGKNLICIVVSPDTIINDTLFAKIIYNIGFGNVTTANYPYDNNEQYWYTENGGNCSVLLPPPSSDGAPIILRKDIKEAYSFVPAPGVHIYFRLPLNIDYPDPVDYPNTSTWDVDNDNFCDYMFYYAKHVNNTPPLQLSAFCLGIETQFPGIHEMDYYYNSIMNRIALDIPAGREFVDINIISDSKVYTGYTSYYHITTVTHGIRTVAYFLDYPISIDK